MATHSSILAWRILWTEEPGRLQAIESHRVGHDRSDLVCIYAYRGQCLLLNYSMGKKKGDNINLHGCKLQMPSSLSLTNTGAQSTCAI